MDNKVILKMEGIYIIFKSLQIKNFRNFDNINIDLSNKNVIFGMNDSGKTNMLHALRFLLDYRIRKNGFVESDYHQMPLKYIHRATQPSGFFYIQILLVHFTHFIISPPIKIGYNEDK